MHISVQTVVQSRYTICSKIGLKNVVELNTNCGTIVSVETEVRSDYTACVALVCVQ